jgi:hypothetical protein
MRSFILAAALVCAAAPALADVKIGQPLPADAVTLDAIKLDGGKADFRMVKRVVIPFFQVEVQEKLAKNATSRQLFGNATANARADIKVQGLADADVQPLVDAAYRRFVARLAASGIEVVPLDRAMAASPRFAKLLSGTKPAPITTDTAGGGRSRFYTPSGMGFYFYGGDTRQSGVFAAFGQMGAATDEAYALIELKDIAMVGLRTTINFVQAQSSDSSWFGRRGGEARIDSKAAAAITPDSTRAWVEPGMALSPKSPNRVSYVLANALIPAVNPVISYAETTSAGKKAGNVIGSLIGGLAGGGSSFDYRDYTVVIDGPRFTDGIGSASNAVADVMGTAIARDLGGAVAPR